MRILKQVLLMLLIQFTLGTVFVNARQETRSPKGARNSEDYLKREVRHELVMVPWYTVFDILQYWINVKGGHVTLEGAVDSEADKNAANLYANSVPNVFTVTNNLLWTATK